MSLQLARRAGSCRKRSGSDGDAGVEVAVEGVVERSLVRNGVGWAVWFCCLVSLQVTASDACRWTT